MNNTINFGKNYESKNTKAIEKTESVRQYKSEQLNDKEQLRETRRE